LLGGLDNKKEIELADLFSLRRSLWHTSYLDEMFLFENEDNTFTTGNEQSDDETPDVDSDEDSGEHLGTPIHIEYTRLRKERLKNSDSDMAMKLRNIINCISSNELDVPLFLDALSWGSPDCHSDRKIQYARTSLLASVELPQILQRWFKPPRHGTDWKGKRPAGARQTMCNFALECITDKIDCEMKASAHLFTSRAQELSETHLLEIDFTKLKEQAQSHAPMLWQLIKQASSTPEQDRNKKKDLGFVHCIFSIILLC
jgi:hypothetical protein